MNSPPNIVLIAVTFEAALGVVGWEIASWAGAPVEPRLALTWAAVLRSLIALAPMLGFLVFSLRTRWGPLVRLRQQVESMVGQIFGGVSWPGLAAVALAAGVGEELLFRGALQPLAERWCGPVAGLVAVSVLFGALHAASTAYFVLATAVGLYLGWLAQTYDDLVAPIAVHAAYDFAALVALCGRRRGEGKRG